MDRQFEKVKNKYLFVINNLSIGGAEKLLVDQINYFYKNGYNVGLLTLINSEKLNFADKLILPTESRFFINSNFNLLSVFKTLLFLKKYKPDIIFSHLFFSNTIVRVAAIFLFKKPKLIIFEHNNYEKEKTNKHLLIDKILSLFTFKIIAISENVREYLLRSGIRAQKVALLKNGVDFSFTDLPLDIDVKKKELGINKNTKIIVSVGNVNFQKGYDILIEAIRQVVRRQPGLRFFICGSNDNDLYRQLDAKVKEYGLQDNIIFLGSRQDVLEIVRLADIFVMPSRWEGLSIALLEAMALGKAIIVSDIESMRLVLENGRDCLMFRSEDSSALADKIVKLLEDKRLQSKLGRAAAERSKEYSINHNIEGLLNIVDGKQPY